MKRERLIDIPALFKSFWVENQNSEYVEDGTIEVTLDKELSKEWNDLMPKEEVVDIVNEALKNVDKLEKDMNDVGKEKKKKKDDKNNSIAHVEQNSTYGERSKGGIER